MIAINLYEILMQIINFCILMFLLKRFLVKPVSEMLQKRADMIKKDIDSAEKSRVQAELLIKEQQAVVQKSRQEARDIIKCAEEDSKKEMTQILQQARQEADEVLSAARKDIEKNKNNAIKELRSFVGDLAIKISEKIIKKQVDVKTQEQIIGEYLSTIKN